MKAALKLLSFTAMGSAIVTLYVVVPVAVTLRPVVGGLLTPLAAAFAITLACGAAIVTSLRRASPGSTGTTDPPGVLPPGYRAALPDRAARLEASEEQAAAGSITRARMRASAPGETRSGLHIDVRCPYAWQRREAERLPGRHRRPLATHPASSRHDPQLRPVVPTRSAMSAGSALVTRTGPPRLRAVRGNQHTFAEPAGPRLPGRCRRLIRRAPWPLIAILALQAVLSLRLVWSNSAFTDEALYLWAGHMEWEHWLHQMPIPAFPAYFSGAPVVYPPIAAIADGIGGLAAARLLSLCFMLGATTLLWSTTSRLYTRRAAFFACGLWAFMGPTLHLTAFATYDAMSVFFATLAAWLVVRAQPRRNTTGWMIIAAIALTLANAAAYSSAIFDPVIIILAFLTGLPVSRKLATTRALELAIYAAALILAVLTIGGPVYAKGVMQTVLVRVPGANPPATVLRDALDWTWPIVVPAVATLVASLIRKSARRQLLLLALLSLTAFLVPIEQARLHTVVSLDKHADIGAWFAAIAAGYAVSRLVGLVQATPRVQMAATALCATALIATGAMGFGQARLIYSWPNSAALINALRPYATTVTGPLLVQSPSIPEYYLGQAIPWWHWSSTSSITLPDGHALSPGVGRIPKPAAYAPLIQEGYFSLIALRHNSLIDRHIISEIQGNKYYRVVGQPPYGAGHYTIWLYEPAVIGSEPAVPPRVQSDGGGLIRSLLPIIHPSAFLTIVGLCFAWAAAAAVLIAIPVRCCWRAGKGLEDV
jgi:Dolichyl-phosphate-mannose-protein mannosyltransferase